MIETVEDYYRAVKALQLSGTTGANVFQDKDGNLFRVPPPQEMTPAQMTETFEMIKKRVQDARGE
jgi:hypothetical protein